MSRIQTVDPTTATGAAKDLLDAVKAQAGMTFNLARVMANQPAVLESFLTFAGTLAKGNFSAKEREAIALSVAGANNCGYCASAHSAMAKGLKVEQAEVDANLEGKSGDAKLNAGLAFTRAIVEKRGFVSDADLAAVREAGYDDAGIVELVGNTAVNIFTNYMNHVADTEIDFPVVELKKSEAA